MIWLPVQLFYFNFFFCVLLGPSGGNKTGIYVVAGVASVALLVVIGGFIIGISKYYSLFPLPIVKVFIGTDPDMTILCLTLLINYFCH